MSEQQDITREQKRQFCCYAKILGKMLCIRNVKLFDNFTSTIICKPCRFQRLKIYRTCDVFSYTAKHLLNHSNREVCDTHTVTMVTTVL